MTTSLPWWQTTTIYQVYPRSFADANNDGIGDLRGIISKLDYIKDLGFETIWFSPFFCSPQQDFGYDVSDYCDIAPEYGTLADAEELINEVHARGMRVLFDLVLNHTSIQHPWFQESRSSRTNPKRDWYIWRDGRGKHPPNNWKAIPGGSGWHYDEATDQWFYASFLPFQPDLNWRNPDVKQAMLAVLRFWLDQGVDGFRLDIFHSIFKDANLQDNPFSWHYLPKDDEAGFFQEWKYSLNQPEVFELAKELRALVHTYSPERILIGEVFGSDENQKRFLGENLDGLNLAFLWELLNLEGTASFLRKVIEHYEHNYPDPYTPVYVFGNHDRKRLMSHIDGHTHLAKLLALFQYTTRGVPVTYYGEEIGMLDGLFSAKTALDPVGQNYAWVPSFLVNMLGLYVNRDGCRTPMQWDSAQHAGFCGVESTPWLPIHNNRSTVNVQDQLGNPDSLLNLYRSLLRLRRDSPALLTGNLDIIHFPGLDEHILAYKRSTADQSLLILFNFGVETITVEGLLGHQKVIFSIAYPEASITSAVHLPAHAALILGI